MGHTSNSAIRNFLYDMFYLLRWGVLQPPKLVSYMQTVHPDLTVHTGVTQQLWLALTSRDVRRFVLLQLALWLSLGVFSIILLLVIRLTFGSFRTLTLEEVGFEAMFSLAGTMILGIALSMIGGVISGVVGSTVGSIGLGLSLGLAFGLTGGTTAAAALGVSGSMVLGMVGSSFDYVRRGTIGLSSTAYWGRSIVGLIFTIICVTIFGLALGAALGVASAAPSTMIDQITVGVVFGIAGSFTLAFATFLELWVERSRRWSARLRWSIADSLVLGVLGGIGGGLTISGQGGVVAGVGLVILWGVLVGAGGGLAMQTGNGLSATLVASGLAWLLIASPTNPLGFNALVTAAVALLAGLFFYVRLPICLVEVPLTRWGYIQALNNPSEIFARLRRTPVYWDDLIFYPLPALDRYLLLALRSDREAGLQEVSFVAKSFQQGWAANRARLSFAVETLSKCTSSEMIANAPAELDWLADEVLVTLQQGAGEMVPRLLAISGG
ncbi:MAG: hypothetical protein AAF485_13175, partial [Chloroflexota bacterium]